MSKTVLRHYFRNGPKRYSLDVIPGPHFRLQNVFLQITLQYFPCPKAATLRNARCSKHQGLFEEKYISILDIFLQ